MNMKDKKNIDDVFKDGLKNLEASPSPRVWDNIQAALKKEKSERKVIPLWIRIGGVAALIAVLLSVGNWAFDPFALDSPAITKENNTHGTEDLIDKSGNEQGNEEIRIASEKNINIEGSRSEENFTEDSKTLKSDDNQSNPSISEEIISPKEISKTSVAAQSTKSATAEGSKNSFGKDDRKQDGIASNQIPSTDISEDKNEGISSEEIISNIKREKEISFETEGKEAIALELDDKATTEDKNEDLNTKVSFLDAIAEQENLKDKEDTKESMTRRWKVTPNVAPVYYSSLGNGSSIDPEFANSPQKGDVNLSYGVQVSYALSPKLSLRTGVNNVDLSYSTSDIIIASGPVGIGLRGVDYGSKQTVVTAISRANLNSSSNNFGALNLKSTSPDARLIQNINYYEIPLELQYSVIDSRFGVSLIGGVSTLFLGNNEISVRADNFNSVLGDANNLSNVSFSTNVGLGLNYKLSKKFIFNVEPMFKYQLNTYSDSSVDFKPYYLGIYSGLSFKF